jgi:formylglycine-generating enzyme required for sulfatase activity
MMPDLKHVAVGLATITTNVLAQDAAAPTNFWDLHGDKILAVLIGGILVRLFAKPIDALQAKAGAWIEHTLQGFGYRAKKRHLAGLIDEHRRLRLIGIYNRADLHPPRLREVYVSLRLAAGKDDEGRDFHLPEIFQGDAKRLVVLGPPGSGKTTLLDYLTLVFAGHVPSALRQQLGNPLPLFARLRRLGEENAGTVLDLLRSTTPVSVPEGYVQRQLRRGGAVVLLDGLDEVLDQDLHHQAAEGIRALVREYPENWYVVTCRVAGWRGQLPDFRTYEIRELSDDDVRQFVGAWYREVLRTQKANLLGAVPDPKELRQAEDDAFAVARERAEALAKSLADNEGLRRMARTPLILSLITLVHYHRVADLPKGRAKLYDKCLEILLELWDLSDKQLKPVGTVSPKGKLLVLKELAFHYLSEDLLEADLKVLDEVVTPLLPELGTEATAKALIEEIWERSGILVELALGRYGFAHRALQDYLAAAYVVENEKDDVLLEHAAEERWREVILIGVGLAPKERAQRLVATFLQQEDDSALAMAGLSLAEDVQVGDDLKRKVRQRLLVRLEAEEAPDAFGRLAGALLTGDPDGARDWMRGVLEGRDPEQRSRILKLLPTLGKEQADGMAPLLVKMITETDEEPAVRVAAARTLAELRIEADGATCDALLKARREAPEVVKVAVGWALCELGRYEELGFVKVPAGEFVMGSEEYSEEKPRHTLFLPTFYMGRYQVTVEQFRGFVEESGFTVRSSRCLKGKADHPVAWVIWPEALAFAKHYGYDLPSEAEWEKAARGTDGRRFPWGDKWQSGRANVSRFLPVAIVRFAFSMIGGSSTTPVGSFSPDGDSPYGCADMSGNVWQWTRSQYRDYPYDPHDGRENHDEAPSRVLRGTSSALNDHHGRCARRDRYGPANVDFIVGFRVVLSPSFLL